MTLSLYFDQIGLLQDSHVMGNGGLRQLHALLDVGGAESGFLADGASSFFLQRAQNPAAHGIGNGLQESVKIGSGVSHDQEA
jgi:hypothetical protein